MLPVLEAPPSAAALPSRWAPAARRVPPRLLLQPPLLVAAPLRLCSCADQLCCCHVGQLRRVQRAAAACGVGVCLVAPPLAVAAVPPPAGWRAAPLLPVACCVVLVSQTSAVGPLEAVVERVVSQPAQAGLGRLAGTAGRC